MEIYVAYEAIRMRNMTTASPRLGVNCKQLRSSFQQYLWQQDTKRYQHDFHLCPRIAIFVSALQITDVYLGT